MEDIEMRNNFESEEVYEAQNDLSENKSDLSEIESENNSNESNIEVDEDTSSNNYFDIDEEHEEHEDHIDALKYNIKEFERESIINNFIILKIIKNNIKCDKCAHNMNLVKCKKFIDGLIWRCKKNGVNKHDSKIKIRKFSFFSDIKVDIRFIYFILFYNYVNNFSIKHKNKNCIELAKDLKINSINRKMVSIIHYIIRYKIM